MTLQQLRFLVAVAQSDLNITAAGAKLGATQPALSRQLKLLEEELGFTLFVRNGRAFSSITSLGERVLKHAYRLLREVQSIREVSAESRDAKSGVLSIGTTHTQARYVLPAVIQRFRAQYPEVEVHLHQGTVEQIAEMALLDRIDLAMASGSRELFTDHILLPCYRWHRRIIAPKDHPLTRIARPTLRQLAAYPLDHLCIQLQLARSSLYELFSRARNCIRMWPLRRRTRMSSRPMSGWDWVSESSPIPLSSRRMLSTLPPSTPPTCFRTTPPGSAFAAAPCWAATPVTSCSCWLPT